MRGREQAKKRLTYRNGDMLEEKDNSSYEQIGSKRTQKFRIYMYRTDMLESSWNGLQDLDGICDLPFTRVTSMPGIEPRSYHKHDKHKSISENRDKEERASSTRVLL